MPTPPLSTSPVSTMLTPGELLLGRYQVLRHVASGGMGQVFEALDLELEQRIALKTLHPRISDNPEALERFKREIRLARRVTHPNVCRLFDFGSYHAVRGEDEREVLFLTMELLEGESLASYVSRRGRLPLEEVATIVEQVACGLEAAHEQGIVHRDLNSRNIHLVMAAGGLRAVITDFGLARQITNASGSTLTLGGDLLGTPAYMAPEQLEGGQIGPPTDIYALGVVIFEMLSGRLPFEGDTPISVAMQHLRKQPPALHELMPDPDPRWEAIALRCLEKQPGRRFGSAADLRRAVGGESFERLAADRFHPRWLLVALGGVLGVALLAGLSTLLGRLPAPRPAPPTAVAATTAEGLPTDPEAARWYAQGLDELGTYRYHNARDSFEKVIAADPRFAMAQVQLAQAQLGVGDRKRAREAARKGLTLARQLSREQQLLVQALYHETNNSSSEAIAAYRELVALFPDSLEYGLALADCLRFFEGAEESQKQLAQLRKLPRPAGDDPRIDLLEASAANTLSDFKAQRRLAESAIAKAVERGWPAVEAKARLVLAVALLRLDSIPASAEEAQRAKELFAAAGEPEAEARAMIEEGWALSHQGHDDLAQQRYRQALERYRELDNASGVGYSLNRLATIAWRAGDAQTALKLYGEAMDLQRETQDLHELGRTAYNYAVVLTETGDYEQARPYFEESLATARKRGSRAGEAINLNSLGAVAIAQGNLAEGALRFGEAAAIHEEIGDRSGAIMPLTNQGATSLRLGNLDEAAKQLGHAQELMTETGDHRTHLSIMLNLAELNLIQDQLDQTATILATLEREMQAAATMPEGRLAIQIQSIALLREQGRAREAVDQAAAVIEQASAGGFAELADWARIRLGRALLDLGRVEEAATAFGEVAARSPSGRNPEIEPERRLLGGLLEVAQGDPKQAQETFSELRSLTEKQGFFAIELETRAQLCALEPTTAASCLKALEKEATAKGFRLLARHARGRSARLKAPSAIQ